MNSQHPPRVAFIGLGNMGWPMCHNLVSKSLWPEQSALVVFNRTRQRCEDLQAQLPPASVVIAESIRGVLDSADIIFTCLSDGQAVREVVEAALASRQAAGKLFVECSTIHPRETADLAADVRQAGACFVACPVFGAPDRAHSGQLVCVPAGTRADVQRVLPYCRGVMGRAVIDLTGRAPETATTLKVLGNSFIFNMAEAVAEGHVLAEKTGLGGALLHEYLSLFFPGIYEAYSQRMLSGDYHKRDEPAFTASLARKDIRHALDLSSTCGARLPALDVVDGHLAAVERLKQEKGDYN
ncbi:putative oxidoreductase YfjR [Colletotrichum trifolii]|uniref:Putative oxidoreductase YfjR n=1 Tax=Colletotrichum trifolii TaxID=5466 RepID=A0A4R8RT65_COLTR|nr:putative oxidoreductase YfjR [Colletotrichum trifolii]